MNPLYTVVGNVDWYSQCGKQYGVSSKKKKKKKELLYDPAIPLLDIHLKKTEAQI